MTGLGSQSILRTWGKRGGLPRYAANRASGNPLYAILELAISASRVADETVDETTAQLFKNLSAYGITAEPPPLKPLEPVESIKTARKKNSHWEECMRSIAIWVFAACAILLLLASHPSSAQGYWYFCKNSGLYYPYAATCAGPWQKVTPGAQPAPTAPSNQQPYYEPPNNSQYSPVCAAHLDQMDSQLVRQEKLARFKACKDEKYRRAAAGREAVLAEQQRQEQARKAAREQAAAEEAERNTAEKRKTAEIARAAAKKQADEKASQDPNAIVVNMTVGVTSANPPVIMGTTNLPDGTILHIFLKGDLPACVPRCGFMHNTTVENGRFTIGSELTGAEKLIPDSYTIEVNASGGNHQPHNVQSVIGKSGEHLRGSYVASFVNGNLQPAKFPWNPAPSSDEYLFGLTIRYTQRISVTRDGEAFPVEGKQLAPMKTREQERFDSASKAQFYDCGNGRSAYANSAEEARRTCAEIARAVPPVSSSALLKFNAVMGLPGKQFTLAWRANICGLRSDRWFRVFSDGVYRLAFVEAERLNLREDSLDALNALIQNDRIEANSMPCQRLVNTRTMDELDRIQSRMTGNYH